MSLSFWDGCLFVFFDSPYDFGFISIPLILVGPVDEGVFDPFSDIQIGVFELIHFVLALIYIFFSSSSHGVVFVCFEAGSKDLDCSNQFSIRL